MGCSILSLVEIFYQIFVLFFVKSNTVGEVKNEEEKLQTPMKDNKAVVIVEDLENEIENGKIE